MKRSLLRTLVLNGALALGASLGCLLVLEAASYAFGRFARPENPLRGGFVEVLGEHDPLLFWRLRPGASDSSGRVVINSEGLRGPSAGQRRAGETRILSLGESTTLGPRLEARETYSTRLEDLLNAARPSAHYRVFNAGVSGYSLFQGYTYLRHRGLRLDPDIVLLYFGYNDFLPIAFLEQRAGEATAKPRGLTDRELHALRQKLPHRVAEWLTRHSNLYRAVAHLRRGDARTAEVGTDPRRPRVPERDRRHLLDAIDALCKKRGVRLVVIVPWYRSFEDHAPLLREFTRRTGTPLVDLPRILDDSALDRPRESYFLDHVHPTAEGHALIATAIGQVLLELSPDRS